jgi:hypothetical protein
MDAATIIRGGSAALYVLLGIAVVGVGRKSFALIALGAFLACFGAPTVQNNLFEPEASWNWPFVLGRALVTLAGLSAIVVGIRLPKAAAPAATWPIVLGLTAGAAAVAFRIGESGGASAFFNDARTPEGGRALDLIIGFATLSYHAGFTIMHAMLASRVAFDPPIDRPAWTRFGALTLAIGPFLVFYAPSASGEPASAWSFAFTLLTVLSVALPWLVAGIRTRRRGAIAFALLWPALGVASYGYLLVPGNVAGIRSDIFGIFGILRVIGWIVLVHAILRHDLLGVPLPRLAVSRGAAAAGALAALFIVAQIAQNFLSATYGLVMGGIVAGAFLFAAQPLQRAFERIGSTSADRAPANTSAPRGQAAAEESYLLALRLALRDKLLSRDEERGLVVLAHDLGIAPRRAHELQDQVEREARAKGGG